MSAFPDITIGLEVVSPTASIIFINRDISEAPTVIVPITENPYLYEVVEVNAYLYGAAV